MVWSVGYGYWTGYSGADEPLRIVLGMPHWVFWAVLFPWVLATLATIVFSLVFIADDDLGETLDDAAKVDGGRREALDE
jgi:hypothetical protein